MCVRLYADLHLHPLHPASAASAYILHSLPVQYMHDSHMRTGMCDAIRNAHADVVHVEVRVYRHNTN